MFTSSSFNRLGCGLLTVEELEYISPFDRWQKADQLPTQSKPFIALSPAGPAG